MPSDQKGGGPGVGETQRDRESLTGGGQTPSFTRRTDIPLGAFRPPGDHPGPRPEGDESSGNFGQGRYDPSLVSVVGAEEDHTSFPPQCGGRAEGPPP